MRKMKVYRLEYSYFSDYFIYFKKLFLAKCFDCSRLRQATVVRLRETQIQWSIIEHGILRLFVQDDYTVKIG
jgi:hypothetical protein